MTTTTLRLNDELKSRIAEAARKHGTTPHHFMLEAIVEKTAAAERRSEFEALADARYAEFLVTGESVPWSEMRAYLEARAAGREALKPRPRKFSL